MKKSTKYSAVIAAALLAVAPMAISNTVKADEKPADSQPAKTVTDTPVKAEPTGKNTNVVFNNDKDKASQTANPVNGMNYTTFANQDKATRIKYGDGTKEHPFTIDTRIGIRGHLTLTHSPNPTFGNITDNFIDGELSKYNIVDAYDYTPDGEAISHFNLNTDYYYTPYDANGKELDWNDNDKLTNGETIVFNGGLSDDTHLNANAWYSWTQPKTLKQYLGNTLVSDLSKYDYEETPLANGGYLVAAKTNNDGSFATIKVNNDDEPESITQFIVPPVTLSIDFNSNDSNSEVSQPTAPAETPAQPTEAAQPSQATNAAQPSTPKKDADQATTPVETPSVKKPLMIKHNAFVYNKHGKLVKKHGVYSVLKKYEDVKPLKHAKIVTIKGKKFYQIGKDRFIKVANTTVKPEMKKISAKATVKGIKASHVRLYNANGKYIKKHVNGKKNLKFDAEKIVKGHLYYRIKGTNNWIRANKVRLHK